MQKEELCAHTLASGTSGLLMKLVFPGFDSDESVSDRDDILDGDEIRRGTGWVRSVCGCRVCAASSRRAGEPERTMRSFSASDSSERALSRAFFASWPSCGDRPASRRGALRSEYRLSHA